MSACRMSKTLDIRKAGNSPYHRNGVRCEEEMPSLQSKELNLSPFVFALNNILKKN